MNAPAVKPVSLTIECNIEQDEQERILDMLDKKQIVINFCLSQQDKNDKLKKTIS